MVMVATNKGASAEFAQREYIALKQQLKFDPRTDVLIAWVALDVALASTALWLLHMGDTLAYILAQPLLALVFFNAFSLMHECGHGSASRHEWLNDLIGHLTSVLCFIPYYPWKYIHQKHHAWTGNIDHDPVLRSLRTWRDGRVPMIVRIAWRSWLPVGALLQHVVYWSYPLQMIRDGEMTRDKLVRCVFSTVWAGGFYAAAVVFAPGLVVSILPALFLFHVAEELVNIPHHSDVSVFDERLPLWEQHRATRSCDYPTGVSELLVLNFNFHIEHHLFPSLPWYRLRTARTLVRAALGESYTQATGLSWNIDKRTKPIEALVAPYRTK